MTDTVAASTTNAGASAGALEAERGQAYCLIRDLQAGDPLAAGKLQALVAAAESEGRTELVRIGLFGRITVAWMDQDPSLAVLIESLVERCMDDQDQAMLALALAVRSALPASGDEAAFDAGRDADLAKAVVALDTADGGALELITARTACGISFGIRSMWELSDNQYQAALALNDQVDGPERDAVLSAVVFNRAENQVAWACTLRQIGDTDGVADRWNSWDLMRATSERYHLPALWRQELDALGLLLAAVAGEDRSAAVEERLAPQPKGRGRQNPTEAHLRLALALSQANIGHRRAAESTEAAIEAIDPEVHPHMFDLAIYLAAELEAMEGRKAGMRCASRQIQQGALDRLVKLNAMKTRIDAERMSVEHERLTREATMDHLTRIGNRRALDVYLDQLRLGAAGAVSLIMTDIDGFKLVNDRHGHHTGDATLATISRFLEDGLDSAHLAVRLGGDEFMVVMADTDIESARQRAECVRQRVASHPWAEMSPGLSVTVSIGVASGPLSGLELISVCADAAVYAAKAAGGDRIVCHVPSER